MSGIKCNRTPLIRTLVIRIANYPDRLCNSRKFVENSTKLTSLEVTGYQIKYSIVLWLVELVRNLVAHGDAREGKWRENWRMECVASTLTPPPNVVYPALLPLMRTPQLSAVDWTDAPADLNGLVLFGERQNLVSAHVPSRSARATKNLPRFVGTRKFITPFTSARHLFLSWSISIQSTPSHYTCWRSTLISSSHLHLGIPNCLFPSDLPTKTLYATLLSFTRATYPAHHFLLDVITRIRFGKETNGAESRKSIRMATQRTARVDDQSFLQCYSLLPVNTLFSAVCVIQLVKKYSVIQNVTFHYQLVSFSQ